MRKLATIKRIDVIRPIEGADAIEVAVVGGWNAVIRKGEFSVGDLAVYCEIDSWIPHTLAPFLSKGKEPREYNGVKGERLRTVKLKGQISQGLLFNMNVIAQVHNVTYYPPDAYQEGTVVDSELGIQKWEAPIPNQLANDVEGPFPSEVPKTDQERIQNLTDELKEWQSNADFTWEVTEKLDGSSMTVFVNNDASGVCSRNWRLKESNGNMWQVARNEQLIEKIRSTGRNLALQGEIIGEGIQSNRYRINGHSFFVFDIYDIDRHSYMSPIERRVFCDTHDIKHVPLISPEMVIEEWVTGLLIMAEDKSKLNNSSEREGLVFKCNTVNDLSFKAISNRFLLKYE